MGLDYNVARRSVVISNLINDLGTGGPITVPEVRGVVMEKIVEWCTHYSSELATLVAVEGHSTICKQASDMSPWDQWFMQVEPDMLCEIILAADFLEISDLLSQGCTTVSNMIKGTSSEQIRMAVGTLDFDESSALKRLHIRHSITSRLSGREISLLYKHLNIEMSKTDRERSMDIARNVFSDPIAIHDFINEGYTLMLLGTQLERLTGYVVYPSPEDTSHYPPQSLTIYTMILKLELSHSSPAKIHAIWETGACYLCSVPYSTPDTAVLSTSADPRISLQSLLPQTTQTNSEANDSVLRIDWNSYKHLLKEPAEAPSTSALLVNHTGSYLFTIGFENSRMKHHSETLNMAFLARTTEVLSREVNNAKLRGVSQRKRAFTLVNTRKPLAWATREQTPSK